MSSAKYKNPKTGEWKSLKGGGSAYKSVKAYGAKGDGATDDTAAFQTALAANRTVFVPGGTYVLSGTLVIAENCCLILSQDTILLFTQTEGNCIELRGSGTLRGNHAIVSVPYAFTGHAISCDTALDGEPHNSIPPYTKADPMFKRQRFIYDVNIIKPNAAGFHRSEDGTCNGTALYFSAEGTASIPWMWAITASGIRIAGGFSYGIRAANFDDPDDYEDNAWNHDMRIEAVIEACEVGVSLENCNGAHLAVTVQPCIATSNSAKYAKWGVHLNDSRFVDMIGSRVWDWNANNSLWTEGGEYQHLALIGNCQGLILDDFLVHETSADIRSLIYTDTESNFDKMTILQEPANKWFKSVDGKPYFNDGTSNKELRLKSDKVTTEETDFVHPADGYYTYTPNFTNLVNGYEDGKAMDANGAVVNLSGYVTTDFIPIDGEAVHTYRIGGEGISFKDDWFYGRITWYDADKNVKAAAYPWNKFDTSEYYPTFVEDDTVAAAFSTGELNTGPNGAAYFRITAKGSGADLIVTVDEAQDYTSIWHGEPKRLDDSIHAKNDWNAAEGEVGHIENRTHFTESRTLYQNDAFPVTGDPVETDFALEFGKTYNVIWNGEQWTCVATFLSGTVFVGNVGLIEGEDTGEPFCIITGEGAIAGVGEAAEGMETATLTIVGEYVEKIPEQFMPYGSAPTYYVDVVKDDSGNYTTTVTPKDLSAAVKNGATIMVRKTVANTDNGTVVVSYLPLTEMMCSAGGVVGTAYFFGPNTNTNTIYRIVLTAPYTDDGQSMEMSAPYTCEGTL